jgi:RHS repeat-associated protein
LQSLLSYTAANQLFFALSPTATTGSYDYTWHWYDGKGLRVVSAVAAGESYNPESPPTPGSGVFSYYVYDGSDVQLALRRSGSSWRLEHRYLVGGIDQPLVGRFTDYQGNRRNLAFVLNQQGTTLAAMKSDGTQESQTEFFSRNPFGRLESATGTGTPLNLQTGFTGASTPNQTGGFTYLRNRWYDPNTGRFLTQDPIGIAGGVNLYTYAGSNPIAFADPFGLCRKYSGGSEDANCRKIVNDLKSTASRAEPGVTTDEPNVFQQAAEGYEATDREVAFVDARDERLDVNKYNSDKNPATVTLGNTDVVGGVIYLDKDLGMGDMMAAATHEILVHGNEKKPPIGDLLPTTKELNFRIFFQMPNDLRPLPKWGTLLYGGH